MDRSLAMISPRATIFDFRENSRVPGSAGSWTASPCASGPPSWRCRWSCSSTPRGSASDPPPSGRTRAAPRGRFVTLQREICSRFGEVLKLRNESLCAPCVPSSAAVGTSPVDVMESRTRITPSGREPPLSRTGESSSASSLQEEELLFMRRSAAACEDVEGARNSKSAVAVSPADRQSANNRPAFSTGDQSDVKKSNRLFIEFRLSQPRMKED